ncbi:MAG: helix-turn-helix transcriptional regulator [Myxococcales bacterium]|nr:helix-turn-helix transcriptional regulator [Myxococcales bacterium]
MLPLTAAEIQQQLADRARSARLRLALTQAGLAARSGVSLGSLRRFERTGEIALASLVKIAIALDAERGFEALFAAPDFETLDEALEGTRRPRRKRGRIG